MARTKPRAIHAIAPAQASRATVFHVLFLFAVTFAVYARGLWNGFVTDDEDEVLKDQLIRSLANIPRLFSHGVWFFAGVKVENYYRPLKLLAYSIEYRLFGFQPAWWHFASILLQLAVVLAAYWLVRDLASRQLAFWTALWFALHPVHAEPVAWIAGGQDLLCASALLLAVLLYHRGRASAAPLVYYGLSIALFAAALLAKETALTFPAVILAYDFLYRGEAVRDLARAWRRYAPYAAVLGVYLVARLHALRGFAPTTSGVALSPLEMFWSVPVLAVKYIWMAIFPIDLNYWHMYVPVKTPGWLPLAAIAIVLGLVFAAFRLRHVRPVLSFALGWFWLTLLPVLNIPKVSSNVFTERYLYVASFGFCVFAAWGWLWLRDRARSHVARRALYAGLAAVLALYATLIVRRLPDWRDTVTLIEKTARQSPNSAYVRGTLGYIYFEQGRFDEALVEAQRAVDLQGNLWSLWVNLGAIHNAQHHWAKAIDACRRGLAIEPNNVTLLNQAGLAWWQNGQREEGLAAWRRAVKSDPGDLETRINFATSLYQLGEFDAAIDQLSHGLNAADLDPRAGPNSEVAYLAHFKLGYIYEQQGEWQAAGNQYQQTLDRKPSFTPAQEQLTGVRARLAGR